MRWLLLLSGGAARGAVQVPVIESLVDRLGLPAAIAGTSIGAGNGAVVAAGELGRLRELWSSIDGARDFQRLQIDVWNGLYSLRRYRELLEEAGAHRTQIPCWVGLVELETGRHRLVELGPLSPDERLDAIVASGTQPGIHERIRFRGQWVGDGGIAHVMPPFPRWGDYDQIHAVACFPMDPRRDAELGRDVNDAVEQAGRAIDLLLVANMRRDIARLRRWAWHGAEVHLYTPPSWASVGPAFDASAERIAERLSLELDEVRL